MFSDFVIETVILRNNIFMIYFQEFFIRPFLHNQEHPRQPQLEKILSISLEIKEENVYKIFVIYVVICYETLQVTVKKITVSNFQKFLLRDLWTRGRTQVKY